MTGIPDTLKTLLWPKDAQTSVYALVDTAGGAGIGDLLAPLASDIAASLYIGALEESFGDIAPHVVAVVPNGRFLAALYEQAWGNSVVSFARSTVGLADIAGHFRGLIGVDIEGEGLSFFRFYDPRVLRLFLPGASGGELEALFGPVLSFVVEGETPCTAVEYSLKSGQLVTRTFETGQADG